MPRVVGIKLVGKSRLEDESDVADELGGGVASTGVADAQWTILSQAEIAGRLNRAVFNTTVCVCACRMDNIMFSCKYMYMYMHVLYVNDNIHTCVCMFRFICCDCMNSQSFESNIITNNYYYN
jgi:hypothetical protein